MKEEDLYSKIHLLFSMTNSTEWLAILSGIEGALLCLERAKGFKGDRNNWIDEAKILAFELSKNNSINENDYPAWFSGFYLNNAELRISSALHRMIKSYLKKNKGKIWKLIDSISDKEISQITVLKKARKKLDDDEVRYNYEIISEDACITRVWRRANEIKHKNKASFDDEHPETRYLDSIISIDYFLKLYCELLLYKVN